MPTGELSFVRRPSGQSQDRRYNVFLSGVEVPAVPDAEEGHQRQERRSAPCQ